MPAHPNGEKNSRFALRVVKLLLKGFALGILVFVSVLLGFFFYLPRLMSGSRTRAILIEALEERLHRPVAIGSIWATFNGIKIGDLSVGGTAQDPGALLRAQSVVLNLDLTHLLEKQIEVGAIHLRGIRLNLRRGVSGPWNVASVFSPDALGKKEINIFGKIPFSLVLSPSGLSIEEGRVQIEDAQSSTTLNVHVVEGDIKPFDFSRPTFLHLSGDVKGIALAHPLNASLTFQGVADFDSFNMDRAFLRAEKFTLKSSSYSVSGAFRLVGFKEPNIDASFQLPVLGPDDWKNLLGHEWNIHLPPCVCDFDADFSSAVIHVRHLALAAGALNAEADGNIDLSRGSLPRAHLAVSVDNFPLDEAASISPPLGVYRLKGTVNAAARMSGALERMKIENSTFSAENFRADIFGAREKASRLDFASKDSFANMSFNAKEAEVRTASNTFSRLNGNFLLLNKRDLFIRSLYFKWHGSIFRGKGRIFPLPKPRIVAIAGSINKINYEEVENFLEQMRNLDSQKARAHFRRSSKTKEPWQKRWVRKFKSFIPRRFPNTMGRIHVGEIVQDDFFVKNVNLLWKLKGVTPRLNYLSGEAGITLGKGEVKDIEALQKSHKLLKIIFLPYVYMHKMNSLSVLSAAEAYPKTLDFNEIQGEYGIRNGVITTRFSYVNGPELIAYAEGKADFAKEKIDMSVLTRLTHYGAPLPEWWVDELGRPSIGFRVTGDLNHPDVEPRLSKIKAGEIEEDVKRGRREERIRFRSLRRLKF